MNKRAMAILLAATLLWVGAAAAFAHSGRTDGSGGHRDNKNASGLGSYHYHCGGNPPHLHSGGVCAYKSGSASATASPTRAAAASVAASPTSAPLDWADVEAGAAVYGRTNAKGVNLRIDASSKAARLDSIGATGTVFEILERAVDEGDAVWYFIRYNGQEGYVKGEFVDLISAEEYSH